MIFIMSVKSCNHVTVYFGTKRDRSRHAETAGRHTKKTARTCT